MFFYESNVAYNVVRHPTFIAAMKAISMASFDYIPPTYHTMQTKHIEPKMKQVKVEIKKVNKQSIALYRAPICFDGWNNNIHWPLMNVILVCLIGDIFIGLIDTTGHKETKVYITEELKSYTEIDGLNNATQICSNNASTMLEALDELVALYLLLYKQV
jgi:hypothetical protein